VHFWLMGEKKRELRPCVLRAADLYLLVGELKMSDG
jgi:hypothetical protein